MPGVKPLLGGRFDQVDAFGGIFFQGQFPAGDVSVKDVKAGDGGKGVYLGGLRFLMLVANACGQVKPVPKAVSALSENRDAVTFDPDFAVILVIQGFGVGCGLVP